MGNSGENSGISRGMDVIRTRRAKAFGAKRGSKSAVFFLLAVICLFGQPTQGQGQMMGEVAKLLASDGATSDSFGYSVAISGDTAIIGAYGDDANGADSGSGYVYRYNGAEWIQTANLTASDGAAGDFFGYSVAIDDNIALVGAYDDNGSNSGSAYVFRFNAPSWVQEAKLTASDGAAGDSFGVSVALNDDTAIIGAHRDDDNGADSGSAYVYRYNGVEWIEAKLTASDGAAGDSFGYSVAISGEAAIIGAWDDDDNGSGSGSAYLFGCPYTIPGDLNGDCKVDFRDFAVMATNWLIDCDQTPSNPACVPK